MNYLFPYPKNGDSWLDILEDSLTRKLLGYDAAMAEKVPYVSGVNSRLKFLLQDPLKHLSFAKIGYTALEAFLQANCTGPPLEFDPVPVIFPAAYLDEVAQIKQEILKSLSVDGIDAYPLAPHIELFWLAKVVMGNDHFAEEGFNGRRARFRVNFWHQKMLSEMSDTLRGILYNDAEILETQLSSRLVYGGAAAEEHMVEFYIERANIRIFYGDEVLAREDLLKAAKIRDFDFALTGALGKRTKFQEHDVTQLVVLARSRDFEPEPYSSRKSSRVEYGSRKSSLAEKSTRSLSLRPLTPTSPRNFDTEPASYLSIEPKPMSPLSTAFQPESIALNDDVLLEEIQFSKPADPATQIVTEKSYLPAKLAFMEAAEQPQLFPMDSIILLAVASSISNTQAADGLTRAETLPYATRVLEGGSSNWSVYTEALLIRSRIEGYNSRTTERGLLQLQALVDQIITETSDTEIVPRTDGTADDASKTTPNTFLTKPSAGESASIADRLRFIHQVSPPFRWELEAELAARWTQMGGLKTALEIYERLQMDAEVALCLAATDREAEATKMLSQTLFMQPEQKMEDGDTVMLKTPLPVDAPRLLCILGDIQAQPKFYDLAWQLSSNRYARAQRSLGRFYLKKHDLALAAEAYTKALQITRFDGSTWFALGCAELELQAWQSAVKSFTRVIQLDDRDAQGWSNLAVALLKLPSSTANTSPAVASPSQILEEDLHNLQIDPLKHKREALRALRRAAELKREDARIWDNYLTVAASIPPNPDNPARGTPWQAVIQAMSQVVALRHKKEGEGCVDLKILDAIIEFVTSVYDYPEATELDTQEEFEAADERQQEHEPKSPPYVSGEEVAAEHFSSVKKAQTLPFVVRALIKLIDTQVVPLASSSAELFLLLSQFALWRHRPAESLNLTEKYWRSSTNTPNATPEDIVDATLTLVTAYRELGPLERERTGGLVESSWKFKSRSCLRSVIGRAKGIWDETEEFHKLENAMNELKLVAD